MTVYGIVTISSELKLKTVEDTPVLNFIISFIEVVGVGENKKYNKHEIYAEIWSSAATYLYNKCKTGDKLFVQGILRQNHWENKDGVRYQRNVVRIQNFQLMNQNFNDRAE